MGVYVYGLLLGHLMEIYGDIITGEGVVILNSPKFLMLIESGG